MPVLMYGSEVMIWKEKERYWIRAVQMDSLRGLLDIKSIGQSTESMDKEVLRSDEGGRRKD